ncbi:MAG: SET domain-containing protein [Rhodospirillales bacterium]
MGKKNKNHECFRVVRSSSGLGLKALRRFKKSEEIIEYTGPRISNEEADERPNRYLFRLNDKYTIDGSPRSNLARYINHSCAPNAQAVLSNDERHITIEAIKRIEEGDEITYDYGREYFDEYIAPLGCKCVKCQASPEE